MRPCRRGRSRPLISPGSDRFLLAGLPGVTAMRMIAVGWRQVLPTGMKWYRCLPRTVTRRRTAHLRNRISGARTPNGTGRSGLRPFGSFVYPFGWWFTPGPRISFGTRGAGNVPNVWGMFGAPGRAMRQLTCASRLRLRSRSAVRERGGNAGSLGGGIFVAATLACPLGRMPGESRSTDRRRS